MSFKVYPVTETKETCNDYAVKINGKEVEVNTARVSKVPFNRRWPGHQRQLNQSEFINFVSLETDGSLDFEIIPKDKFEKVTVRPAALGIEPEIKDGVIKFTLEKNSYFTVEAFGRNRALHIFADPISNYNTDFSDENVLYYGKGEHDVGTIVMKSNQTLFIDEGAVVYGCVKAVDAENIKILGRGILDNSKNKEVILFEANEKNNDAAVKNAKRQHTVQLEYCTNVEIDGITMRDSLVYNIRPIGCKNFSCKNVKIIGCWRYNSDGIDMHNCVDVLIDNCFIRTFDDSICIKGFDCYYEGDVEAAVKKMMYRNGKSYDVFKNVLVKNCVIWNDWGKCLEIGAETRAEEICNVVFEDCDIIHVTGPVLDCNNVDYADVHHITYQNINVEFDDVIPKSRLQKSDEDEYVNDNPDHTPTLIQSVVEFHHEYSAGGNRRGKNRELLFKNIHLYGRQTPVARFVGYSEDAKTQDVLVTELYWNGKRITDKSEIVFEMNSHCENIRFE